MTCKVADAKSKAHILVDGFRRNTVDSYTSIRHSVVQTLFAVGSRPRELIFCETKWSQQSVQAAFLIAAVGIQDPFGDASGSWSGARAELLRTLGLMSRLGQSLHYTLDASRVTAGLNKDYL